jgi:osmotically-inducible protein OsmY
MARRLCGLLLLAIGMAAGQAPVESDGIIHDQLLIKLSVDRDVRGAGIQVDVKDGVVTLSGVVRDKKAREKAAKLAKKMKGVKSVVNQLKLPEEK